MVEFCLGFYFVRNNDIWWYFVDVFLDYGGKGCIIHVALMAKFVTQYDVFLLGII